jgi:hypothetical protein
MYIISVYPDFTPNNANIQNIINDLDFEGVNIYSNIRVSQLPELFNAVKEVRGYDIKYIGPAGKTRPSCFEISISKRTKDIYTKHICQIEINTNKKKIKGIKNIKFMPSLIISDIIHIDNIMSIYLSTVISEEGEDDKIL